MVNLTMCFLQNAIRVTATRVVAADTKGDQTWDLCCGKEDRVEAYEGILEVAR